ncbi:MAG TPA: MucR family transcriptional regulator [Allosphingosinicella sp.]|jgi:predicted transcriptional regulator
MMEQEQLITLTADIVAAHVSNNTVAVGDIGNLVQRVHEALTGLGQPQEEAPQGKTPVVSIRASVKPDYIVCMECGRKQKTLKRHLQTAHGMSPDEYRRDYGLPRDYPMAAPNYSKRRSEMAQAIGLGRNRKRSAAPAGGGAAGGNGGGKDAKKAPARRGRRKASET